MRCKKNKWKIIIPVLLVAILAGAFYFGGNAPGARGWKTGGGSLAASQEPLTEAGELDTLSAKRPVENLAPTPDVEPSKKPGSEPEVTQTPSPKPEVTQTPSPKPEVTQTPSPKPAETQTPSPKPTMEINPETGKDRYLTDPVPEGKPLPVEPQDAVIGSTAYTCTISISCATVLDNMELCDPEKVELVPEDGWILQPVAVTFYEGESVFNVLQRVCKQLSIHMEYEHTPIYNSAYIEGIHNLYEFDVGELSGWMYKVNGWFPNYGASRYQLKNCDVIDWVYTCDLGCDVGGGYVTGS